jgi:nucleoside-diphosphate-sugar epimerase
MSIGSKAVDETTVLVTGGTGFVGGHAIVRLLNEGYRVRTTIRSGDRESEVLAAVAAGGAKAEARLGFAVADLSSDAGWAQAVAGADHVLHVASPFTGAGPDDDRNVIDPARDGTIRVLTAARDAGVRRVVLTSSFAAVGYSTAPTAEYTEADWTDPADDNTAYIRSKVFAERAAWDFLAAEGGALELAVINPTGIFGPVLGPRLSGSVGLVKAMLAGQLPAVPRTFFGIVDVRDVVDLHLRAMTSPGAPGQRFLAAQGTAVSFLQMAQMLSRHLGDLAARVPSVEMTDEQVIAAAATNPGLKEAVSRLGRIPVISNTKARTVLGWQPRDSETTIADTVDSLVRQAEDLSAGRWAAR